MEVDRFLTGDQTQRSWDFCLAMWVLAAPNGQGGYTLTHYQDFSNLLFNRQDTDWRIPSKDEIVNALDAGLLGALDGSPAAGYQPFDPTNDWLWWSSTSAGKVKGQDTAYAVSIPDGAVRTFGVAGTIYGSVPVRGVAPPPPPTKGKGK